MIKRRVLIKSIHFNYKPHGNSLLSGTYNYIAPSSLLPIFQDVQQQLLEKGVPFYYEASEIRNGGKCMALLIKCKNKDVYNVIMNKFTSEYGDRFEFDWSCSRWKWRYEY